MNKRQLKKLNKKTLNTERDLLITGGFLTPFACPNCFLLFKSGHIFKITDCPNCGQSLNVEKAKSLI